MATAAAPVTSRGAPQRASAAAAAQVKARNTPINGTERVSISEGLPAYLDQPYHWDQGAQKPEPARHHKGQPAP